MLQPWGSTTAKATTLLSASTTATMTMILNIPISLQLLPRPHQTGTDTPGRPHLACLNLGIRLHGLSEGLYQSRPHATRRPNPPCFCFCIHFPILKVSLPPGPLPPIEFPIASTIFVLGFVIESLRGALGRRFLDHPLTIDALRQGARGRQRLRSPTPHSSSHCHSICKKKRGGPSKRLPPTVGNSGREQTLVSRADGWGFGVIASKTDRWRARSESPAPAARYSAR